MHGIRGREPPDPHEEHDDQHHDMPRANPVLRTQHGGFGVFRHPSPPTQ